MIRKPMTAKAFYNGYLNKPENLNIPFKSLPNHLDKYFGRKWCIFCWSVLTFALNCYLFVRLICWNLIVRKWTFCELQWCFIRTLNVLELYGCFNTRGQQLPANLYKTAWIHCVSGRFPHEWINRYTKYKNAYTWAHLANYTCMNWVYY